MNKYILLIHKFKQKNYAKKALDTSTSKYG